MMGCRAVRILVTALCLVPALFVGPAPGQGFVVCVGMDGHLDVASLDRGCGDCGPASGADPCSATMRGADACCPCIDVPVGSGADATPAGPARPLSGDGGSHLASLPPTWGPGPHLDRLRPAPNAPSSAGAGVAHLQRRSVVLLI